MLAGHGFVVPVSLEEEARRAHLSVGSSAGDECTEARRMNWCTRSRGRTGTHPCPPLAVKRQHSSCSQGWVLHPEPPVLRGSDSSKGRKSLPEQSLLQCGAWQPEERWPGWPGSRAAQCRCPSYAWTSPLPVPWECWLAARLDPCCSQLGEGFPRLCSQCVLHEPAHFVLEW